MAVSKPVLIEPPSLRLHRVVDDSHVGVLGGQGVGDLRGAVGRLVVDDDQLVVADDAVGDHLRADRRRRVDRPLDVVLLVPHREEDRQQLGGRLRHIGVRQDGVTGRCATLDPVEPVDQPGGARGAPSPAAPASPASDATPRRSAR